MASSQTDTHWIYNNNPGHALIASQSIHIGGDDKPYWYCVTCGNRKDDEKPKHGEVCGAALRKESKIKFDKCCAAAFPFLADPILKERVEHEIESKKDSYPKSYTAFRELLSENWKDILEYVEEDYLDYEGREQTISNVTLDELLRDMLVKDRNGDDDFLYDQSICNSTEYHREQREGLCLDRQYGEWMQLWSELCEKK